MREEKLYEELTDDIGENTVVGYLNIYYMRMWTEFR
jgi:hypothetical protein